VPGVVEVLHKARIACASSGFVDLLNRHITASTHNIAQIEEIVGKDELLALKPEKWTRNIATSKAIFGGFRLFTFMSIM